MADANLGREALERELVGEDTCYCRPAPEDVLAQLDTLRGQMSGVSIDEEAATMLRFQRAYEANARFFGVVDGLLEEMLNQMGR